MQERGRRSARRRRRIGRALVLLAAWAALSGCLGPGAVRFTRMRYNEVVRETNDQQLLMNLVRLRYADSPVFIDLPTIISQFELAAGGSDPGPSGSQTNFGVAGGWARDTPTINYHPREGREIAKALLTPLSADLFSVINAGASIEQLLLLTINDLNDVPNAPRATTLTPTVSDDNAEFLRGIRLLEALRDREGTELAIGTTDLSDDMSDPIDKDAVDGGHLLDAATKGYAFRSQGNGRMALVRRQKDLFLKIRAPFVNSHEMAEFARIFHLTPGLDRYRIRSELSDETSSGPPKPLDDHDRGTIYLNMRSVLQIMTFLSKGVCVPEEHVRSGVVPMTPGPDGRPFDWTRITAGNFFIASQKHRPKDAEVAVEYRGYWFYIAPQDVRSRAILSFLEVLFALQESGERFAGPALTLPLGG